MANMLSGAAVMDGAMLVIAANEPMPQPQTREHLLALQMLGMRQLVIVQNKVDLVTDDQAREHYAGIQAFVRDSVAEDAPIIPVSAQHKLNIDALLSGIYEVVKPPPRDPGAPPRLHVLRSFDVNRPGAGVPELKGGVLGGTLLQGELAVGGEVELRPGLLNERSGKYEPITSEVVSVGTGAGLVDRVRPGGLVAVATKLDPTLTKGDALVGSVIGLPGHLPPVHESLSLDVELFETAVGTPELVKVERVRTGEPLRLNVGTAVTLAVVTSARNGRVEASLKRPVCAAPGSRIAISRRIADRWRLIGSGLTQ
jgi:translation initiation factor 2 subunit 3